MGPTLVAIAVGMLPNLGSFASLTEQISRDLALPRSPSRALSARMITTAAAALLVLGAFLSFRDYIRD
jgi:hypothetical protein